MDRTVPKTGGEPIQLYMRTYYSLLRSSDFVAIDTLVETHIGMQSSLHVGAGDLMPDVSALLYSALRLPECITRIERIIVGQIERSIVEAGYRDAPQWRRVFAPGRRRRMHYNDEESLLVYVVSRSDIDDLIPILTAYQIEWNKLHLILRDMGLRDFLEAHREADLTDEDRQTLADGLKMSVRDLQRLQIVWQEAFIETLLRIAEHPKDMQVSLISGSMADYRRATASWWDEIRRASRVDLEGRPLYFVSSNTHAMVNLLTGFATRYEESLLETIRAHNHEALLGEYEALQRSSSKSIENFLYYILGKFIAQDQTRLTDRLSADVKQIGVQRVLNKYGFEIEAQVIELNQLRLDWFDPRLERPQVLTNSEAVILNIDYPLGMAAYEILSRVTERNAYILGVYVMGKAATLNGRIGDVMIPNVVHDEHSQNTYLFDNCFSARHLKPYMTMGNILDNQKAITALGTFLQNPVYMDVFYREGYTDIEMEGGPYLSAVYEAFRPKRHPDNEIVNLYGVPFDLGILHYASDMPLRHGHNLGAGSLRYAGVEPTYATALAILNRIFRLEINRRNESRTSPVLPEAGSA